MKKSENNFYIYLSILGVCCGPISTGYILGYSSPTIRDLSNVLSTVQKSTFASLLYIGGILGSIIVGYVMDKYGRKRSILYSAIPAIIGWIMIIFFSVNNTNYVYLLYFIRILGGLSCGMNMACTTVYLIEISPTAWRGTIASLNQVGITVGIFLAYAFGKFLPYNQSAFVALAFAIGLCVAGLLIPESPRWNLSKDAGSDANRLLRSEHDDIEHDKREITSDDSFTSDKTPRHVISLTGMFQPKYRSKTLIIIQLMMIQQLTGINAFISYADILFIYSMRNSFLISNLPMIIGLVQIIFTAVATLLMDRFDRKTFLKIAGSLMSVSMLLVCISFRNEIEILTIASMALYIVGFSIGWGPIPVISCTEMSPQEARSSAGSIAVMTSWIGGYLVTSTFPLLNFTFGQESVFFIFGLICAGAVVFVVRKLPETKGMSLETMPV